MNRVRAFFMGSGVIAIPVLAALVHDSRIDLVGCATQPDQPQGRKRRQEATPVGRWCDEHQIAVEKPKSVNDSAFLRLLGTLNLDIVVVLAFGQLLKEQLLQLPRCGCVNVHASLLPKYRGASPIAAAILGGEIVSGISIMKMVRALDAGPVYRQHETTLTGTEYADDLEEQLGDLAGAKIGDAVCQIADGSLRSHEQNSDVASYAGKITKSDGEIDWSGPSAFIERQVRAYHPWPGAWCVRSSGKSRRIVISAASVCEESDERPGTILQADKHGLRVACGIGSLNLQRIVPEGKREMTGIEFLRGNPLAKGTLF